MNIEDHSLIVTLDADTIHYPLPTLAMDARVKVWVVPADYRANRLFVAVTAAGGEEEIPACSLSDCRYLGELPLAADPAQVLEALKAAKREAINSACNAAIAALAAKYPEREIHSWPQQVKDAEAINQSPKAAAPLLNSIANARGIPVSELATRVIEKAAAYATASGELIGRRQALEDRVTEAKNIEDLNNIGWKHDLALPLN